MRPIATLYISLLLLLANICFAQEQRPLQAVPHNQELTQQPLELLPPFQKDASELSQNADPAAFLDAVGAYGEGRYEEALSQLTQIAAIYPQDDAVSYYLGMCKLALKQVDAGQHLERAVASDSTNTWYLDALMNYYGAVGNKAKFADVGERLVKLSPTHASNPYTLYLMGDAMLSISCDSLALKYFDKALEREADYPPAQFGRMEALMQLGNMPQFFIAFEAFIRNPLVRAEIKIEYLKNIFDKMEARFYWMYGKNLLQLVDICYELYPEQPKAHLLKVQTHLIQGETQQAMDKCLIMAAVSKEAQDTENEAQAYNILGDIFSNQGKMRECFRAYDQALKANPDCIPVLNNYAYYLSEQKRQLKKALKMSARVIELAPDNATYLDTYGWILYLLRRPAEAKAHFKRAMLYGGKDSAVVLAHYAKVLRALKEDELASYYENLATQKAAK